MKYLKDVYKKLTFFCLLVKVNINNIKYIIYITLLCSKPMMYENILFAVSTLEKYFYQMALFISF